MRLKRVKIFGFKTFADKTEFDVDGDIIAVVGPNGCGKSNIVDAILWGLGEGSVKQLRAASSQDVIFNGSSRRKPVGYAEVTLLFDNEDGALPIETSEVTITRRLNRAGESEYSINRRTCRLRDIFDLLADSGLGRSGYAIVGQKEIDQALAASPEDRRAWVDEAAGVQRYRSRKVESLRRLASAHDHLSRVTDILNEIEAQREPLREEAEVARRYKSIVASLKEVETGLLVVEVARAAREVDELERKIEDSLDKVQSESKRAEDLDEQVKQKGRQISELEREMDVLRAGQQESLTALERASAAISLAEQKLKSLDDLEHNMGEEAQNARQRIEEARAELEILRKEAEIEDANLHRVRAECSGAGDEAKELTEHLEAVERKLEGARQAHALRLKREAEISHNKQRSKEVKREIQGIEAGMPDLEQGVAEAQEAFDEQQALHADIEERIKALRAQIQQLESEEHKQAVEVRRTLAEKASLEGRRRGIEATIEAHEGLNQGARAVLEAVDRGDLHGNYVPVGEAIEVEKEMAVAIETALGGAANDLIVDDEHAAKAAIEHLKRHRLGRATFQPIPLMRPQEPEMKRLLNERGVIGRASELVTCRSSHRPVIDSLLGRILVVEDLDVALKLGKTGGWNRMVSLEGEVLHERGAVTGGQTAKGMYGLVQRKADLTELNHQIEAIERTLKGQEKAAKGRADQRAKLDDEIKARQDDLAAKADDLAESKQWLANLQDELNAAQKSRGKLEAELEALTGKDAEAGPEIDLPALEKERDALLKQLAARSADAEQAETRLRDAESRLNQALSRAQIAERRLQLAEEADQQRERKITNLGPERERIKHEIERAAKERDKADKAKQDAEKRLAIAQDGKRGLLEESFRISEQMKDARSNAQVVQDAIHQAELQRARADSKRAASLQRLFEEYGLSQEDALEQEPGIELPPDAAAVVSKLRREMKQMGEVNLGAIEAYERLTDRATELTEQRADILGGIEQVEASIKELDSLTRDRFLSTFEQLEGAFEQMFQKLFAGGEGKISLSNPENVLESGIDIDVTLPGKKRQRLELLSGGERSLCATAFLFSLLKVKPSPLVVLDEVDAPLDGRNVERFIGLLREFSQITQFIVITHNDTTMQAAPVLVGVTMQEPGVSILVPIRMPEDQPEPPDLLTSTSTALN
jgi:chromosome segregation protein